MDARSVEITASDGFRLHATLYDANSDRALVVAAAMGVKRRYYDAFAQYVASQGWSVVAFDYRGMGDSRPSSLRGFPATMEEWGRYDIRAMIDWVTRELHPTTLAYVGHSAGGQLAGLAPNATAVDRFVFVCSQSGYWRHWPGLRAYGLGALWAAMPVVSAIAGHFPSRLFGLGSEDLPRGIASQWARWGRHPEYLFRDVDAAPYARITAPILAYSFVDDHYAPRRAVDALLAKYSAANVMRVHIEERGIGHFDFFRRAKGAPLWGDVVAWLTQTGPDRLPSTAAARSRPVPVPP